MILVFYDMDYIQQKNTMTWLRVPGYFIMENVSMEDKANLRDRVCFHGDRQKLGKVRFDGASDDDQTSYIDENPT